MKALFRLLAPVLLQAFMAVAAGAQAVPDHQALMSPAWEIIGELRYAEDSPGEYVPVYSRALKALEGKEVELQGYMVPYERGVKYSRFALSVLPLFQCQFCGSGGIPPIVEVEATDPVRFSYKPITMKGRIKLNPDDVEKLEILLTGAVRMEK